MAKEDQLICSTCGKMSNHFQETLSPQEENINNLIQLKKKI